MTSRVAIVLAGFLTVATAHAQSGQVCRTIDYEGIPNQQQVPAFNGVSAGGWVGGISYAAGGTAQFVNPPSGITVAVFLNGQSNTITFSSPVTRVQYYYATAYAFTVTAYNTAGNVVATVNAPGNWFQTQVYVNWSLLQVQSPGNLIASINIVSTGPVNNFFGLDDLQYCTTVGVDSVEMTQAIQQIQTLAALKSSLNNGNEPPVPIIAGKPGVMRVYMKTVFEAALVDVTLSIPNVISQTQTVTLVPGCKPVQQRNQGCPSTDFYFTPPSGSWTATLEVHDLDGNLVEQHVLPFKSRDTQPLRLAAVSVCDDYGGFLGSQRCGAASDLVGKTAFLEKIAPTSSVTVDVTADSMFRDHSSITCTIKCYDAPWWNSIVAVLGRLYMVEAGGSASPAPPNPYTVYYGMVRPIQSDYTGMSSLKSHQAASFTSDLIFTPKIESAPQTVAHETGHALGLKHTNSPVPQVTTPPGCDAFAQDDSTDWPWKGTSSQSPGSNQIQSAQGLEVGFDVIAKKALNPNFTYELMSYCFPKWIAPQRYKTEIETLGGGAVTSPSVAPVPLAPTTARAVAPRPRAVSTQPFWMVTGTVPPSGPGQFGPLFQSTITADTGGGSGPYSLEVQNAASAVLFTQHFALGTYIPEADNEAPVADPEFAQLVPVAAGAARIVLKDPSSVVLATLTLSGAAPTVTVTSPTALYSGSGPITWTIDDPDSTNFTSRVYYSANNGATWSEIGEVANSVTFLDANFSNLPGSNGNGLIRILVSDGVNTGQATSARFSIAKKSPSVVQINSPEPNFSQPAASAVLLSGTAYDTDDGVLSGTSLSWTSNLQGALGAGSRLSVLLQPGVHTVTLTARDSDNNSLSATTTVTSAGQPPALNVAFNLLSAPPTSNSTCVQVRVNAVPGANGAPLSSVQYSTNGGATFTGIPPNQLPFTFLIPGTGFIDLVFTATDTSSQIDALSTSYFNLFTCGSLSVPNVVGLTQAAAVTALNNAAFAVGSVTAVSSGTVPAGKIISQDPVPGTAVPPGASDSVNLVVSTGVPAALSIAKSHTGNFGQGQLSATYTVTVSNGAGAGPTNGEVTVTETVPAGMTLLSMTGTDWTCSTNSCKRSSVLNPGSSYPPIAVVVSVAAGAPASLTNQVSVSGGGSANANASDLTSISPFTCDLNLDQAMNVADVQLIINEALGVVQAVHDLTHDSVVNVADVQKMINAALGLGCPY